MMKWPILPLTAAALAGSSVLAYAGVCSDAVASMQAHVDARLDAIAGSGRAGVESGAALIHRQPTPSSVAAAEEKLGELSPEKWARSGSPWRVRARPTRRATRPHANARSQRRRP